MENCSKQWELPVHAESFCWTQDRPIDGREGLVQQSRTRHLALERFQRKMPNHFGPSYGLSKNYWSWKLGGRFSKKALVPSFASWVSKSCPNSSASRANPSVRGKSCPARRACKAARIAGAPLLLMRSAKAWARGNKSDCGQTSFTNPRVRASSAEIFAPRQD